MTIEPNLTGGLNITLDHDENSAMLPYPLDYIVGLGVQNGSTKIRRVTIEYVTDNEEHYIITQYDGVRQ